MSIFREFDLEHIDRFLLIWLNPMNGWRMRSYPDIVGAQEDRRHVRQHEDAILTYILDVENIPDCLTVSDTPTPPCPPGYVLSYGDDDVPGSAYCEDATLTFVVDTENIGEGASKFCEHGIAVDGYCDLCAEVPPNEPLKFLLNCY